MTAKARKSAGFKPAWGAPLATLGIVALTFAVYFALSEGAAYVHPLSRLDPYGVSSASLAASVSYSFVHVGLKHALGNMAVLLVMGAVLERKIGWRHMLGIYFASGIIAGLVYAIARPEVWVVGASAAISGVIFAAMVADVKRAIPLLLISMLLVPVAVFPATDYALDSLQGSKQAAVASLSEKASVIEKDLSAVVSNRANASGEELQLLMAQEEALTETLGKTRLAQAEQLRMETEITKGRQTEAVTPVSFLIHALGMLVAAAYLFSFKRESYSRLKGDLLGIVKF